MSWLIAEGYQEEALFSSRSEWSHGRLIRATPHRRVLEIDGRHRSFLVKHFVPSGIWKASMEVLRASPAAREWKALHEARHRGLSVPMPVALGEGGKMWKPESFLVTEFIEEAVPLGRYLFGPDRLVGSSRSRAVQEVARLIRRAHDAGFYQPDLHAENILLRSGRKELDPFLIDLQRVSFSSSLSLRRRWHNLSVLNGGCTEANLVDRVRFLRSYLSSGPPLRIEFREAAARLEKGGRRHRFHLWRSRNKRCLAENGEFLRVEAGGFSGFARRNLWTAEFHELFQELYGSRPHPGIRWIKGFSTRTVGLLSLPRGKFCIKKYRCDGFGAALKSLFCSSQARREWMAANSVRMRGVAVPLPVAYVERRRFLFLSDSYFIAADAEGEKVSAILSRLVVPGPALSDKRALIWSMARWLRKIHACGVSGLEFGDLNIVVKTENPGKFRFSILDCSKARFGPVFWRRRMQDIIKLGEAWAHCAWISRTDKLRFLENYLGFREHEKWRKIWRYGAHRRTGRILTAWFLY
ncbi:MAG TPA: lipopolysaccharide kinase InaA family protein [Candidatus Binatia bacterium]|nr:lipopolysaccharide kinase InaA family protein [Candidatus Binatia bacterium]